MIRKKICMLGAFAVGKTSLVMRFVKSMFSEKYLTTVGVKIDKKVVAVGDTVVSMVIWDIQGEDELQKVNMSYLRGTAGYFLVVDGTRKSTLATAGQLKEDVEDAVGSVPFVCILNKADLEDEWEIEGSAAHELTARGWTVTRGSAKTGEGVEEAFHHLAQKMLET